MKTIRVEASRPYDVKIGYGLLSALGALVGAVRPRCRIALVTDTNVYALYGRAAIESLQAEGFRVFPIVLTPGEGSKTMQTLTMILMEMAAQGLARNDLVLALGGGVVGDIAGFAASCYLRGVDIVQVPTTLLGAVDASVGGKTGVNLPQGKNLSGSFWQPCLVVCDCDTFSTLPSGVFCDGVVEGLKYGVICDRKLFEAIAQGGMDEDCMELVARCVQIKAEYVREDEKDHGKRQMLNFGHTLGHALETLSGYAISHGTAVAIGMVGMARVSEALGICKMGCAGLIMAMLDRLEVPWGISYDPDEAARAAMQDKKRLDDTITLVIPEMIGHCVLYPVPSSELPRMFHLAKGERI